MLEYFAYMVMAMYCADKGYHLYKHYKHEYDDYKSRYKPISRAKRKKK